VISLVIVIVVVAFINRVFYSNLLSINNETAINSKCSAFNLYLLKISKSEGVHIKNYGLIDETDYYITFENNVGKTYTVLKKGDVIYINKVKLCSDVDSFKITIDRSMEESVFFEMVIDEEIYDFQYVLS
jgi:hypothetical protein